MSGSHSGSLLPVGAAQYDVVWSGKWEQDPGGREIMALACREQQILTTREKESGELAIVKGQPHFGIIRLVDIRTRE